MYATRSGDEHCLVFRPLYWEALRLSGFDYNALSVSSPFFRTLLCPYSDLFASYIFLGIYTHSGFDYNALSLYFPRIRHNRVAFHHNRDLITDLRFKKCLKVNLVTQIGSVPSQNRKQ